MPETRILSDKYQVIGLDIIQKEDALAPIRGSEVRIAFLSSDIKKMSKGRFIFGQCEKVPDKYKWAFPYDFTITIFEPNIEDFSEEQLRILLLHELMHIGVALNDDGEEIYRIIPHDIEDFRAIIDRYGMDWALIAATQA